MEAINTEIHCSYFILTIDSRFYQLQNLLVPVSLKRNLTMICNVSLYIRHISPVAFTDL